mgnify:CR=1 FL=1
MSVSFLILCMEEPIAPVAIAHTRSRSVSADPIAILIIQRGCSPHVFLEQDLIKPGAIESRQFQLKIAEECLSESTLVVLPTGLGKTVIALIVIAKTLGVKNGKVLFLAPTKPLVDQHASFLAENLTEGTITTFTGEVKPEQREELWKESRIIVSTPQVIENDLDAGRGSVTDFDLIVFDEAHRAVGDYAYVRIAAKYSLQKAVSYTHLTLPTKRIV